MVGRAWNGLLELSLHGKMKVFRVCSVVVEVIACYIVSCHLSSVVVRLGLVVLCDQHSVGHGLECGKP